MASLRKKFAHLAFLLFILSQQSLFSDGQTADTTVDNTEQVRSTSDYEEESTVESIDDDNTEKQEEGDLQSQLPGELQSQLPVGEENETEETSLPVSTGSSRAPTLQDILSGLDANSPLPPHLQLTLVSSANMSALNLTSNLTAEVKKITCRPRNVSALNETDFYLPVVKMVTSKELLQRLSATNDTFANCIVVMFYAPWCPFCAKVAPHFNALPKVFPQIDFMAIDAINFNNLNARFGTTAVPNLLFFHKSKVVRFNTTVRTIESMAKFINNITSLKFNRSLLEVTDLDYVGPLSSVPTHERDYLLWLSWIFIISFSSYMFSRSHTGLRLWNYVNSFGAVHEHHHID